MLHETPKMGENAVDVFLKNVSLMLATQKGRF